MQHLDDLPKRHPITSCEPAGGVTAVQVPQCQTVRTEVEVRVGALRVLKGIGVGDQVPAHAEGGDEVVHAHRFLDGVTRVGDDVG